jgi:hypothetical protein
MEMVQISRTDGRTGVGGVNVAVSNDSQRIATVSQHISKRFGNCSPSCSIADTPDAPDTPDTPDTHKTV